MNIIRPILDLHAKRSLAAARRGVRVLLGGALIATTGLVATTGVAGATTVGQVTDVVTLSGRVFLTPAVAGTGRFVFLSDTCVVTSASQQPVPCSFVGSGTVTATGGEARGVVTSRNGVILLDETYVFTGPTTAHGTGTARSIKRGGPTAGTFTADLISTTTGNPNVLLQTGTITVRAS